MAVPKSAFQRRSRAALFAGILAALGSLAMLVGTARAPQASIPALPGEAFARGVRLHRHVEGGPAITLSAETIRWRHPRVLGPFRAGFLRELAARDVRIRIDLSETASRRPSVVTDGVASVLRELAPPERRVSAVSLDGVRLEVRSPSGPPVVVAAAAGRWRPGDAGLVLWKATVRSEGRRAEFAELVWRSGARPHRVRSGRSRSENESVLEEILAASTARLSEEP